MVTKIRKPFAERSNLALKLWMMWTEHKFKVARKASALVEFILQLDLMIRPNLIVNVRTWIQSQKNPYARLLVNNIHWVWKSAALFIILCPRQSVFVVRSVAISDFHMIYIKVMILSLFIIINAISRIDFLFYLFIFCANGINSQYKFREEERLYNYCAAEDKTFNRCWIILLYYFFVKCTQHLHNKTIITI